MPDLKSNWDNQFCWHTIFHFQRPKKHYMPKNQRMLHSKEQINFQMGLLTKFKIIFVFLNGKLQCSACDSHTIKNHTLHTAVNHIWQILFYIIGFLLTWLSPFFFIEKASEAWFRVAIWKIFLSSFSHFPNIVGS